MRRADAVELGHGQLALVGAAAAEDDVALAKAQLGADNVAALTPAANVQVAGIKVDKSDTDLFRRISRLDTVVHAFRERRFFQRRAVAVDERRNALVRAVGLEVLQGAAGGD